MTEATIGPLLGLVEPPLRSQGLRLGSWSSRCAAESCACAPGAAVALSVRGMLVAISSTAILRRLQSRDADEGPMDVVLLELLTLLIELIAPEGSLQPWGPWQPPRGRAAGPGRAGQGLWWRQCASFPFDAAQSGVRAKRPRN